MEYLVNKITKEHKVFKPGIILSGETLKEWRLVFSDKDGWIPWNGEEECPVPEDQEIEYCMNRHGIINTKKPDYLRWWFLPHSGTNIVGYRPILNTRSTSDDWDRGRSTPSWYSMPVY